MSLYSDWIRWIATCRDRRGCGMTSGDTMHRGLGEYDSLRPCPNGLPIDLRAPGDCEAWRNRVENARKDIEASRQGIVVSNLIVSLTPVARKSFWKAVHNGRN